MNTRVITVGGKTITLGETTLRSDFKRSEQLRALAQAKTTADDLLGLAAWSYVNLTACVIAGDLPTLEETLDLPLREVTAWREAAQELNPAWFQFPEPSEQEQEKKAS